MTNKNKIKLMNCYFIYLQPTQNIELIYNFCLSYTTNNYIILIKPSFINQHDRYQFIHTKSHNKSNNRIILCDKLRSLYSIAQSYLWSNTIHVFHNITSTLNGTNKFKIELSTYQYKELMKNSLIQYCEDIKHMELALIKWQTQNSKN
jgi:hypothetical protein